MENEKTALELILNLQDAGITNEYVNKILLQVDKENKKAQQSGYKKALETVYDKFNSSINFNTQYLKNWLNKLSIKC